MTAASGRSAEKGLAPVPDHWEWWDGSPLPESGELRWGYTTGAAAAAALTASLLALKGQAEDSVPLLFGDGATRGIPLDPPDAAWPGWTRVRKNGGDDPDCTHGLVVYGRLTLLDGIPPVGGADTGAGARSDAGTGAGPDTGSDERDIELAAKAARVRLHCVSGVGVCTRDGLDCRKGRWAVNPGVLAMLAANLARAGIGEGLWLAEIAIPEGAALAAKTLNRTLGIEGGLSLLGTTGLVRPFSHEAYMATVRVCLRAAARAGRTAVLCTGRRTLQSAREWCLARCEGSGTDDLPRLPDHMDETSFVSIADFVGESLRAARAFALERIIVCCMPGKLLKYAAGHDNTHAHKVGQDMALLAERLGLLYPERPELAAAALACPSMRQAMEMLDAAGQEAVIADLAALALPRFLRLCRDPAKEGEAQAPPPSFALLLTDFSGRVTRLVPDRTFLADADGLDTPSPTPSHSLPGQQD
ncbi:MAG: cobalt-precorrin-5B (C(1))-methyltransferase CbiD [Desulfovibrionaceae bacterium]|nr:cobalt-precorrin-5B (C(1))-methyltransferase CbiD [Desulfovibrionaceae bacterium]